MKIVIQVVLAIASILIGYLIWDSIDSKIVLTENVAVRRNAAKERLSYIADAQIEYKKVRGAYAGSFDDLIGFLKNDSVIQVKMEGEVPDSLIGKEALALELGIITRDTTKIPVRNILFMENFDNIVDSMQFIPYSAGKKFDITSGSIEKNKMKTSVFEVKAALADIYLGLKTDNEGYNMKDFLAVGSMEESTTNGNWKD